MRDEEIREDGLIDLGSATELTHGDPHDFEDEGPLKPNRKRID